MFIESDEIDEEPPKQENKEIYSFDCPSKIENKNFDFKVTKKEHLYRNCYLPSLKDPEIHFYTDPESGKLFLIEHEQKNKVRSK